MANLWMRSDSKEIIFVVATYLHGLFQCIDVKAHAALIKVIEEVPPLKILKISIFAWGIL
jgi:hypothetical protein